MSEPTVSQRTPLYQVLHGKRYQRQETIREIEQVTQRRLLVYFDIGVSPISGIWQGDVGPLQDLIMDCEQGCEIDLFLQTPGGDIDVAEKIVYMLRRRAAGLRVIVVERAKSAGTLIALAADEIVMSDTSELGPIDPQIQVPAPGSTGGLIFRPAHSFLDGLEQIKEQVIRDGGNLNPVYYPLLHQLDPALLDFCSKAIDRSQQFAEKWLLRHMLHGKRKKAAQIANRLVRDKTYITSHAMVIDGEEAAKLGLKVQYLSPDDGLWKLMWHLFLQYQVESQQTGLVKAFESNKVSVLQP